VHRSRSEPGVLSPQTNLVYFNANLCWRPWLPGSPDLFGVKAASSHYAVPGSVAAYVVTWAYVSGRTAWCGRLLESLFPLCSFSGGPCDQLLLVRGSARTSFPLAECYTCCALWWIGGLIPAGRRIDRDDGFYHGP
jgi:hypothetical protein